MGKKVTNFVATSNPALSDLLAVIRPSGSLGSRNRRSTLQQVLNGMSSLSTSFTVAEADRLPIVDDTDGVAKAVSVSGLREIMLSARQVIAGSGLTGGGALSADVTLNVGAGDGITVAVDTVAVDVTVVRTSGDQMIAGVKEFTTRVGVGMSPAGIFEVYQSTKGGSGTHLRVNPNQGSPTPIVSLRPFDATDTHNPTAGDGPALDFYQTFSPGGPDILAGRIFLHREFSSNGNPSSRLEFYLHDGADFNREFFMVKEGRFGIGGGAAPDSGTNVLAILNGSPGSAQSDVIKFASEDLSAGNTTLSIRSESTATSIDGSTLLGTGTPAADRTVNLKINGTVLAFLASTVFA